MAQAGQALAAIGIEIAQRRDQAMVSESRFNLTMASLDTQKQYGTRITSANSISEIEKIRKDWSEKGSKILQELYEEQLAGLSSRARRAYEQDRESVFETNFKIDNSIVSEIGRRGGVILSDQAVMLAKAGNMQQAIAHIESNGGFFGSDAERHDLIRTVKFHAYLRMLEQRAGDGDALNELLGVINNDPHFVNEPDYKAQFKNRALGYKRLPEELQRLRGEELSESAPQVTDNVIKTALEGNVTPESLRGAREQADEMLGHPDKSVRKQGEKYRGRLNDIENLSAMDTKTNAEGITRLHTITADYLSDPKATESGFIEALQVETLDQGNMSLEDYRAAVEDGKELARKVPAHLRGTTKFGLFRVPGVIEEIREGAKREFSTEVDIQTPYPVGRERNITILDMTRNANTLFFEWLKEVPREDLLKMSREDVLKKAGDIHENVWQEKLDEVYRIVPEGLQSMIQRAFELGHPPSKILQSIELRPYVLQSSRTN